MIQKLWGLVQKEARPRFLTLLAMVTVGGFVELSGIGATAEMMGLVASKGARLTGGPISLVLKLSGVVNDTDRLRVGLLTTIAILGFVHGYGIAKTYLRSQFVWVQDKEITTRLFNACLHRPYAWFLQQNSAQLQRILSSGHITQGLINALLAAVGHISVAVTLTIALLIADPAVAVVGVGVVCLAYFLVRVYTQKTLGEIGSQAHYFDAARKVTAQDALTGIRFVKTTARENFFVRRYQALSARASKGMVFHGIYVDTVKGFLEWVTFAAILSLSVYLVIHADSFETLLPTLTLYTMAGYRIIPAIHELFGLWSRLKFDSRYLAQIEDLLYRTEVEEAAETEPVEGLEESPLLLNLQDVHFQYEGADREAVREVSLQVEKGRWIGVVGVTGAGKTTLLDIISGLLYPSRGEVRVADSVLSGKNVKHWQSLIGVVPQEVILLDDSITRNVAFGVECENIDHEKVREVCRMAGIATLVESLPAAYETRLGERGTRLSGGERQRVGLARALYRTPSLLLLDEATSALDQATERRIISTLESLTEECTMITVAHRLSSVKPCHRIVVMEDGRIIDSGTFEELIERSPSFRNLALQTAGT